MRFKDMDEKTREEWLKKRKRETQERLKNGFTTIVHKRDGTVEITHYNAEESEVSNKKS